MSLARKSALVIACLMLGSVISPVTGTASHSPRDNKCYKFTDDEKELARRINQARGRDNKGKMHHDPELSKVARTNSKKMAREHTLEHTGLTKLRNRVTREVLIGEAVVMANNPKQMMRLMMGSPTHRALILGQFEHFGVGIVNGKWATVVFSGHKNPGTKLNMPNC